MVYNIVNFVVTKVTGTPVYPVLTWEGWLGFFVPLGTVIMTLCIYYCLELLSKWRLRRNDHNKVVDIMEGQRFKQSQIKTSASMKQEAQASVF